MEEVLIKLKRALPDSVVPVDVEDSGVVSICTEDQALFWSQFMGATAARRTVTLMDPVWPRQWLEEARASIGGQEPDSSPAILVPTSGSTGVPKFCIHDLTTLFSAGEAFAERFATRGIRHAVSVLPANHVSGLMPVFRAAACGGRVHFASHRELQGVAAAPFKLAEATISLVPTQLRALMQSQPGRDLLRAFGLILVGGAACPPDVLEGARNSNLNLSPCYGSTETAAMVTAMDPDVFLRGQTGVGCPLPHARVEVDENGNVLVNAPSVCLGYHPAVPGFQRQPFPTGDIGLLEEDGNLHILGRADRVINTGGEKVHPEQVESAALSSGLVSAARCEAVKDPHWGQRVELTVAAMAEPGEDSLRAFLKNALPPYAMPKRIHWAGELPARK